MSVIESLSGWLRGASFIVAVVGALTVLSGCNESVEQLIAKAGALRDAGNFPTAIIKLQAALAQDPKNVPARLLSAQIHIDLAEGDAALGLLIRAQHDGASEREIAKLRVQAALVAQRYDDVIKATEAPPDDLPSAARASLLAYRGTALAALGRQAEANAALEQGLALDPHSVDVRIAAVRRAVDSGDLNAARRELADAMEEAPKDRRLRSLQGDIAYTAGDYPAAEQIFQKIVDAEPWNQLAHGELAAVQAAQDKLSEALATVDAILDDPDMDDVPTIPLLTYVRAVVAFRQQNYAVAQSESEDIVKKVPQFEPARLIAGSSAYALHEYERAYYYLSLYVSQHSEDIRARKLLAATQLQLARPADAAKTLSPVGDQASDDPDLLKLIGVAAARSGDVAAADRYLKLALEKRPDDWSLRAELGAADIAAGDPKAGIDNLEQVVKAHRDAVGPEFSLFVAFMQTREYDKALAIAEQVIKSQPNSPFGELLASAVYLSQRNVAAAREALLKAREIHRGDVSVNKNLAKLALVDGKPDEARQYYREILEANPQSSQTYIALADLEARSRHPQAAEAVLLKGIDANPTDSTIPVALMRYQLARGEAQQAAARGQQALKKFPRNPAVLDVVGHAELAMGQRDDALSTFSDLVNIAPGVARAHADLAEAYLAKYTRDTPQWPAINEATEAVKLDPHDTAAKLLLARALTTHRRFVEAGVVIDGLKKTSPRDLEVIELDGVVARGLGRLADAAASFTRALAVKDNALDRRRLAEAESGLGRTDDAGKTLGTWLAAHPEDAETRRMWADICVKDGRLAEAGQQYAELVKREANNPTLQNNLAWILSQLGQSEEALSHSRAAITLAPESVDFVDTLGEILLRSGKPEQAIDAFDKARQKDPDRPIIRFHLAQALAAGDRKSEAVDLLRQLLAAKDPFSERAQAQDLLRRIGG